MKALEKAAQKAICEYDENAVGCEKFKRAAKVKKKPVKSYSSDARLDLSRIVDPEKIDLFTGNWGTLTKELKDRIRSGDLGKEGIKSLTDSIIEYKANILKEIAKDTEDSKVGLTDAHEQKIIINE